MVEDLGGGAADDLGPPPELSFFTGMVWPVPFAFAGAVAAMRFEQGDVLYRDPSAYDSLEGKIPKGLSAIQVILPKRSNRAAASEVELIDLARGKSETRVLTQGKLAMAIFRGDDTWLDPAREEPPILRSARELQQRLEETVSSFDARQTARRGSRFLFVVDLAGDASRSKAAGVEEALRATGAVDRIELSAEDAGIEDPQTYHPSVVVRGLVMPNRPPDEVLPILRGQLYGGASKELDGADGSGSHEPAPDRFSVGRHGLLQSVPVQPGATRPQSSRT